MLKSSDYYSLFMRLHGNPLSKNRGRNNRKYNKITEYKQSNWFTSKTISNRLEDSRPKKISKGE